MSLPIPMSISPDLISFAICATAVRPDEHCRLTVLIGTLRSGDAHFATFSGESHPHKHL